MSWAIWITGLPGSGKTTLARAVSTALAAEGIRVRVLELDEIRRVLTPAPTYSDTERDLVYRALAYMAKLLTEAGVPVLVDATAHRRAWRDLARALIPVFAEVQLTCPLAVCRVREAGRRGGHAPPGIYARSGAPGSTVPGVDVPYEPSPAPELRLDTAGEALEGSVRAVVALARNLAARAARAGAGTGGASPAGSRAAGGEPRPPAAGSGSRPSAPPEGAAAEPISPEARRPGAPGDPRARTPAVGGVAAASTGRPPAARAADGPAGASAARRADAVEPAGGTGTAGVREGWGPPAYPPPTATRDGAAAPGEGGPAPAPGGRRAADPAAPGAGTP